MTSMTSMRWSDAADKLFPPADPYIQDPVGWGTIKLGMELWSKQREILESVRDYRYTAVASCHGPGKSTVASVAGSWWLDSHPWGEAFLVTTAPSWAQVKTILWRELRRRWRQGQLPGRITQDCVWHMSQSGKKMGEDEEEVAIGRKPADYDENTFQGIHARYFMAILDEACGIDEWLWNAVLSLATNLNSRVLAIGNPDDPNSRFAEVCKKWERQENANVIYISAFDTPAFTGESVSSELLEVLVDHTWVEDRRADWGEGTPIWISKVLGRFPDISEDYLFPPRILNMAKKTELPGFERGRYGLDVARFGDAKSVLYRNRGGHIRLTDSWGMMDTVGTKNRAVAMACSHGNVKVPITVDSTGVGAGVFDQMRAEGHPVISYYGAERARNPKRFANRRSEIYWEFREEMADGLVDLDEADEKLFGQLGSIKWSLNSRDQIQVETKEDMRERGLPSPDYADGCILSKVDTPSVLEEQKRRYMEGERQHSITGDLINKVM